MAEYTVELKNLAAHVERKLKAMVDSVPNSLAKTAMEGAEYVKANTIPVAFGELRDSTKASPTNTGAKIETSAPHAAAVEVGSRPHTPPLEPLIRWVKLRGSQGITKRGFIRDPKPTRRPTVRSGHRMQAYQVATALKAMETGFGVLGVDAPLEIARAIQHSISVRGTKPYRYMLKALPRIVRIMVRNLRDGFQRAINRT